MSVYEVKTQATVTETYRVVAENEQEAASKAGLMFRNDNAPEIIAKSFLEASSNSIRQTKASLHFFYAVGLTASCPDFNQPLLSQI